MRMVRFPAYLVALLTAVLSMVTAAHAVVAPPTITKKFGDAAIPVGGMTSLTFKITNPNGVQLSGIGFSDTLPAGLVVATPNGLSGACDAGTITAVAGSTTISLAGASRNAGGSCTFSVNVTGTTAGLQSNTTSAVTSTEGGTGGTASDSITVAVPPTITKKFGDAAIPVGGTTSLKFKITNSNGVKLNGIGFNDTLPAGLVVATPNGLSGACDAGTITATAGSDTISLAGASRAAGDSCTFSVDVTGTVAGLQSNTTSAVTSTEGGTGGTASDSITVAVPPTITKKFGDAAIPVGGTTSLKFKITNPNGVKLNGIGFNDTLPAGLVVATPNGLSGACDAGTITATAGSDTISLAGASRAAGDSCTFSVDVTGTVAGLQSNTTSAVTSTEGGTGGTASDSITVVAPPTITKKFGAAHIPLNGTTSLTFKITNPNGVQLTGIGFTDTLPAGLVVATPNGLSGACDAGTITAIAGSNTISLAGASRAAGGMCTFSVDVTGTVAGVQNNTTGAVTSNNGGTGGTASDSVTVVAPPTISKAFGTAAIPFNGTTSLSFTITNPAANTVGLTGVAFSDTLPAGLVVATPNGLSGSCGSGTITATAGSNSISLSGGTIAVGDSCTFSLNVTGILGGQQNNTTGVITSTKSGPGATSNTAVLSVSDNDAVPDAVEDGAPNNGDGNHDGIPDKLQDNVTSFPSATGRGYVTLVASGPGSCSFLRNVQAVSPATLPSDPGFLYPFGLWGFQLNCAGSTMITVILHSGTTAAPLNTYREYGPIAPSFGPAQFYTLPSSAPTNVAFTTLTLPGGTPETVVEVTFDLTDGLLGDGTPVDTMIVDPSGVGVSVSAEAPVASWWGLLSLVVLLMWVGLRQRRLQSAGSAD